MARDAETTHPGRWRIEPDSDKGLEAQALPPEIGRLQSISTGIPSALCVPSQTNDHGRSGSGVKKNNRIVDSPKRLDKKHPHTVR